MYWKIFRADILIIYLIQQKIDSNDSLIFSEKSRQEELWVLPWSLVHDSEEVSLHVFAKSCC